MHRRHEGIKRGRTFVRLLSNNQNIQRGSIARDTD
jgi:hypothetical protein